MVSQEKLMNSYQMILFQAIENILHQYSNDPTVL